jgi:hypothetical protein
MWRETLFIVLNRVDLMASPEYQRWPRILAAIVMVELLSRSVPHAIYALLGNPHQHVFLRPN